jgi:hypothetical protein
MPTPALSDDNSAVIDRLCTALRSETRRFIPQYFEEFDEERATLEELTEYAHERATTAASRDELKTQLHHIHLPTLADAGLLEYDPKSNVVAYDEEHSLDTWFELVDVIDN